MTTNYEKGRSFEYRVRDDMRERGYWSQRSPKSGTAVDIYGYHMGIGIFIQAKRDGRITWDEVCALVSLAKVHNGIALFAEPRVKKGKRRMGIIYWLLDYWVIDKHDPRLTVFEPPTFK